VQPSQKLKGRSTVSDSEDVLTNHQHIFRKTITACTQNKTGMVPYLGDVHTLCVDTVIILFHVTNITSNIHLNHALLLGLLSLN